MAASNYWTPRTEKVWEESYDPEGGWSGYVDRTSYDWNPASGYATPAAYLAATYGVPEWAAGFFDNYVQQGNAPDTLDYYLGRGAFPYDSAGFYRPAPDGSGLIAYGASDEFGNWDKRGAFLDAARQALGNAGVAIPLSDAQNTYSRSEIPQTGLDFQGYLNKQYVNPRTVDVPGLGQFLTADKRNEFDWGLGDRSGFLETLFTQMLPTALAMYGIGTGIGSLANAAGIGGTGGMAGMAEGYGALEASMGTPSSYVGSAAGATTTPLATLPSIGETALPAATGGTTTLPATGDFSLVPQGSNAGIGGVGTAGTGLQVPGAAATGVGAGSGSLGLNMGTGGIIADTAAQLGAGAIGTGAGLLNPGGTTTQTGASPTGTTTPTSPVTDAADNVYNPENPSNPIPNTTTPTPKSLMQQLEELLGLPVNSLSGTSQAATTSPFLKGLGALGSALLSNYNTNKLTDAIGRAQEQADPFGSQRGFYQNMLKESYTNPNFFKDNTTLGGIRNMAVNDVSRAMAAQGYNQSTNALYGIGQRLQDEGTKYALGFQNQLGQLAGAGISPQEAARLGVQGTQLANTGRAQTFTNIGDLARELPNIMKGFGLT